MTTIFIVRPFGSDRSVIKKDKATGKDEKVSFNFDKVETDLIIPSMDKTGLTGGTTLRFFQSGEIREDMFSELLLADIVIADVSIHNANVFYELGVRHALRKRMTVLIKCRGFDETPFDINGYRYITYEKDNPAASINDLATAINETVSSINIDSPVFNMLPQLPEQETEKFLAVPDEFGVEVNLATKSKMVGKLKLLYNESRDVKWEMQANRYLGESFFKVKAYKESRDCWEKIIERNKKDQQANYRLSTVYQKLAGFEIDRNPARAEELLTKSDISIEIILAMYKELDLDKRAEICGLKGSNAKTRWVNEWKILTGEPKERAALRSSNLESAYECYERGYYENLNHYYSGINALGLLAVIISLAKRYPDEWSSVHDDDEQWSVSKLEDKFKRLSVSMQFTLEAEKKRLKAADKKDQWYDITDADFNFLTSGDPGKVAIKYSRAFLGADDFSIESAKNQLNLYGNLNVLSANVTAALNALEAIPKKSTGEKVHYLLFTGHMIDKPDRAVARFPASKESAVIQKIAEKVNGVLASVSNGTTIIGIAGGACGGDILFHEVCIGLGIKTQLFLAMPREGFIKNSVGFAGPDWIGRFDKIYTDNDILKFELSEKEELPKWLKTKANYSIWQRNNLWELNSALVNEGTNMTMIALWDGAITGDGPGGTVDMVSKAKERAAKVIEIPMNSV